MGVKLPKVPIPRNYTDYQGQQRQKAIFRQTATPAKLSPRGAAKIRQQLDRMLSK